MKKLLMFVLMLFMVFSFPVNAMRFYGSRVFNCKEYVTLRKNPSSSSKTLIKVKYGKRVDWNYGTKKKNGYYSVTYGGKDGWINAKYLNFSQEAFGCTWGTAKVKRNTITIRKKQDSSSKKIVKVKKGQLVFISYERSNPGTDEYVYVNYRGKKGYAKMRDLKEVD